MGGDDEVRVAWLRGDDESDWFSVSVDGEIIPGEFWLACAMHESHRPEPPEGVTVPEEVMAEAQHQMHECLGFAEAD
jgi:hypothetical protein